MLLVVLVLVLCDANNDDIPGPSSPTGVQAPNAEVDIGKWKRHCSADSQSLSHHRPGSYARKYLHTCLW